MSRLKNLKKEILSCLQQYLSARNDDKTLTYAVWVNFYNDIVFRLPADQNGKEEWAIRLNDLYKLPSQDAIKRIRASIQNNKTKPQYPPTDLAVAIKRGWQEEDWRNFLGLNPELRKVY